MSKTIGRLVFALAAGTLALSSAPAWSKDFAYDEKTNKQIADKLKLPVYFAVPNSARAPLAKDFTTTDRLIDFKHPDAKKGDVGLRLIVAKRGGMAERLGKSGLIQTGDLLLTFRVEWGGAGPYTNVQMGISHTGVAYVKNGVVHNIDNPLNAEYLGSNGQLNSEHYRTLQFIHVIRPRNLTDAQRANLLEWSMRLAGNSGKIYPKQIAFNQDYNAPKYKRGKSLEFVKHLGQIGLGQNPPGTVDMFCSEFAWSLLSLKDCEPAKAGDTFKGSRIPSCVKEPMKPMSATGDYITRRGRGSNAGLTEGPLLVVDSLKLPAEEKKQVLHSIFVENPKNMTKLSPGHKTLAESMKPKFAPLEQYYLGVGGNWGPTIQARMVSIAFNRGIPENYSPTSFLINTLLPANNINRTMDYVATIMIE
jgi:hypothetical protein